MPGLTPLDPRPARPTGVYLDMLERPQPVVAVCLLGPVAQFRSSGCYRIRMECLGRIV